MHKLTRSSALLYECFRRDFPCYCYKMAVATADTCSRSPVPKAVQVIKIYTDENGESKFGSFKITMSGSGKLLNPAAVHVPVASCLSWSSRYQMCTYVHMYPKRFYSYLM